METKVLAVAAVEQAYQAELGNMFSVLVTAIVETQTPEGEQQAVARFQKGLGFATAALERAREAVNKMK